MKVADLNTADAIPTCSKPSADAHDASSVSRKNNNNNCTRIHNAIIKIIRAGSVEKKSDTMTLENVRRPSSSDGPWKKEGLSLSSRPARLTVCFSDSTAVFRTPQNLYLFSPFRRTFSHVRVFPFLLLLLLIFVLFSDCAFAATNLAAFDQCSPNKNPLRRCLRFSGSHLPLDGKDPTDPMNTDPADLTCPLFEEVEQLTCFNPCWRGAYFSSTRQYETCVRDPVAGGGGPFYDAINRGNSAFSYDCAGLNYPITSYCVHSCWERLQRVRQERYMNETSGTVVSDFASVTKSPSHGTIDWENIDYRRVTCVRFSPTESTPKSLDEDLCGPGFECGIHTVIPNILTNATLIPAFSPISCASVDDPDYSLLHKHLYRCVTVATESDLDFARWLSGSPYDFPCEVGTYEWGVFCMNPCPQRDFMVCSARFTGEELAIASANHFGPCGNLLSPPSSEKAYCIHMCWERHDGMFWHCGAHEDGGDVNDEDICGAGSGCKQQVPEALVDDLGLCSDTDPLAICFGIDPYRFLDDGRYESLGIKADGKACASASSYCHNPCPTKYQMCTSYFSTFVSRHESSGALIPCDVSENYPDETTPRCIHVCWHRYYSDQYTCSSISSGASADDQDICGVGYGCLFSAYVPPFEQCAPFTDINARCVKSSWGSPDQYPPYYDPRPYSFDHMKLPCGKAEEGYVCTNRDCKSFEVCVVDSSPIYQKFAGTDPENSVYSQSFHREGVDPSAYGYIPCSDPPDSATAPEVGEGHCLPACWVRYNTLNMFCRRAAEASDSTADEDICGAGRACVYVAPVGELEPCNPYEFSHRCIHVTSTIENVILDNMSASAVCAGVSMICSIGCSNALDVCVDYNTVTPAMARGAGLLGECNSGGAIPAVCINSCVYENNMSNFKCAPLIAFSSDDPTNSNGGGQGEAVADDYVCGAREIQLGSDMDGVAPMSNSRCFWTGEALALCNPHDITRQCTRVPKSRYLAEMVAGGGMLPPPSAGVDLTCSIDGVFYENPYDNAEQGRKTIGWGEGEGDGDGQEDTEIQIGFTDFLSEESVFVCNSPCPAMFSCQRFSLDDFNVAQRVRYSQRCNQPDSVNTDIFKNGNVISYQGDLWTEPTYNSRCLSTCIDPQYYRCVSLNMTDPAEAALENVFACQQGYGCKPFKAPYDSCSESEPAYRCAPRFTAELLAHFPNVNPRPDLTNDDGLCAPGTYCYNPCGDGYRCVEHDSLAFGRWRESGSEALCGSDSRVCISECYIQNPAATDFLECIDSGVPGLEDATACGVGSGKTCQVVGKLYDSCDALDPYRVCLPHNLGNGLPDPSISVANKARADDTIYCPRGALCQAGECGAGFVCAFNQAADGSQYTFEEACGSFMFSTCAPLCANESAICLPFNASEEAAGGGGENLPGQCEPGAKCQIVGGYNEGCSPTDALRRCYVKGWYTQYATPLPEPQGDDAVCYRGKVCSNPCGPHYSCENTDTVTGGIVFNYQWCNDDAVSITAKGCKSTCDTLNSSLTGYACAPITADDPEGTVGDEACGGPSSNLICKPVTLNQFDVCSPTDPTKVCVLLIHMPVDASQHAPDDLSCPASHSCRNGCSQKPFHVCIHVFDFPDGLSPDTYSNPECGDFGGCASLCDKKYRRWGEDCFPMSVNDTVEDDDICGPGHTCKKAVQFLETCGAAGLDENRVCSSITESRIRPTAQQVEGYSNDSRCMYGYYCGNACPREDHRCVERLPRQWNSRPCGLDTQCVHACLIAYPNSAMSGPNSLVCLAVGAGEKDEPSICGAGRRCKRNPFWAALDPLPTTTDAGEEESSTTTTTASATTQPASTQPPPPPRPVPQTLVSPALSPFSDRYPRYELPAPQLFGLYSDIPLQFTTSFESVFPYSRRFQVATTTSSSSSAVHHRLLKQSIAVDYTAGARELLTAVAITKTTSAGDYWRVSTHPSNRFGWGDSSWGVPTAYSLAGQSELPSSGWVSVFDNSVILNDIAAQPCGSLITAAPILPGTVYRSAPFAVRVEVGPKANLPTAPCKPQFLWSGMAYSSLPFTRKPTLSFIHFLPSANSAVPDTAQGVVDSFKNSSSPLSSHWGGADSEVFSAIPVIGTTASYASASSSAAAAPVPMIPMTFTGNPSNPSIGVRAAPYQRHMFQLIPFTRDNFETFTIPSTSSSATSVSVDAIKLGTSTAKAVGCHSGDMFSYDGSYVAPNTPIPSAFIGGAPSSCYLFGTVDDIHLACDQRSDCVGFTSIRMPGPKERPLCLYLRTSSSSSSSSTSSSSDVMPYQRMLYKKPEETYSNPRALACNAIVEESGSIAVSIQQTYLASSAVTIRVDDVVVATCGREKPFANNHIGADGRCNVYSLCAVVKAKQSSRVEVRFAPATASSSSSSSGGGGGSSGGMRHAGCENSFGVVMEQTAVDAVQEAFVPEAPIPILTGIPTSEWNIPTGLWRRVSNTLHASPRAQRLFAYKSNRVAMKVLQTGHSCRLPSSTCADPNNDAADDFSTITISSASTCVRCGGRKGFLKGWEGFSDRCDEVYQYCAPHMRTVDLTQSQLVSDSASSATTTTTPVSCDTFANSATPLEPTAFYPPPASHYTGMLTINAQVDRFAYATGECRGFRAIVIGERDAEAGGGGTSDFEVPLFPLKQRDASESSGDEGVKQQQILLGIPSSRLLHSSGAGSSGGGDWRLLVRDVLLKLNVEESSPSAAVTPATLANFDTLEKVEANIPALMLPSSFSSLFPSYSSSSSSTFAMRTSTIATTTGDASPNDKIAVHYVPWDVIYNRSVFYERKTLPDYLTANNISVTDWDLNTIGNALAEKGLEPPPMPSLNDVVSHSIHTNITLVCVVDDNGEEESLCTFPIPKGTTRVKISTAQIDFVESAMVVEVMAFGRNDVVTSSSRCGGGGMGGGGGGRSATSTNNNLFGTFPGMQDRCDAYYDCIDEYIFENDGYAEGVPVIGEDGANTLLYTPGIVTVRLPASLTGRSCDFSAVIVATFSKWAPTEPAYCDSTPSTDSNFADAAKIFECKGERKCVEPSSICDGIYDCFSGSDESSCLGWHSLPSEKFCAPSNSSGDDGDGHDSTTVAEEGGGGGEDANLIAFRTPTEQSHTFQQCRQMAILYGSPAFTFSVIDTSSFAVGGPTPAPSFGIKVGVEVPGTYTNGGHCTVYNSSFARAEILLRPERYVCAAASEDNRRGGNDGGGALLPPLRYLSETTYIVPIDVPTFGLCRSTVQCHGSGNATEMIEEEYPNGGGGGADSKPSLSSSSSLLAAVLALSGASSVNSRCQCSCKEGFRGSDCTERLRLDGMWQLVASFFHPEEEARNDNNGGSLGRTFSSSASLLQNEGEELAQIIAARTDRINAALVESVLTLNSRKVLVRCGGVAPHPTNFSVSLVSCSIARSPQFSNDANVVKAHFKRLLSSSSSSSSSSSASSAMLELLNTMLTSAFNAWNGGGGGGGSPATENPILFELSARTTMNPVVPIGLCGGNGGELTNMSACPSIPFAFDRLQLDVYSSVPIVSTSVTVTNNNADDADNGQQRRLGDGNTTEAMDCVPIATYADAGCYRSSCTLGGLSGSPAAGTAITVSEVLKSEPTLLTENVDCAFEGAIVPSLFVAFGNVDVTTSEAVVTKEIDYSGYLISAITIFLGGALIAWVVGITCLVLYRRRLRGLLRTVDTSQLTSEVEVSKTMMLVNLAFSKGVRSWSELFVVEDRKSTDPTDKNSDSHHQNRACLMALKEKQINVIDASAIEEKKEEAVKEEKGVEIGLDDNDNGLGAADRLDGGRGDGDALRRFDDDDDNNSGDDESIIDGKEGDRWAVGLSSVGLLLAVGASFLSIYYAKSFGLEGNFRVMYEEYTDAQCSQSPVAYMPTRIFAVPEGSYDCEKMESTGESAGIAYATGECFNEDYRSWQALFYQHNKNGESDAGGGANSLQSAFYSARFKMGGSRSECTEDAKEVVLASGACVHITDIEPDSKRNVYVQLTCSTSSSVLMRTSSLTKLTEMADVFVDVPTSAPRPEASIRTQLLSPSIASSSQQVGLAAFTVKYISNYRLGTSSSAFMIATNADENDKASTLSSSLTSRSIVLDSYASPLDFDGDHDGMRLVMQDSVCTFQKFSSSLSSSSSAYSSSTTPSGGSNLQVKAREIAPLMGTDALAASEARADGLGPNTRDVPIGHILNGFGTSTQRTWEGAGAQAHRYYGVEGTAFDMGAHFPAKRDNPTDDDGYTVSLWLRADETTQGFAYAVTDAFEHTFSGTVYPLQRLGEMIANGKGSSAWFGHTYKVYQSLYVNGPGKSLVFAYASPTLTERLHLLEYDLTEIGMERVVNGLWHHVAIAFMVENGRVRAQLSVDGESSYTKAGWSVCVQEFPESVSRFDDVVPVYSPITDTVTRGAMVVTGYFNGGVYSVKATPKALLNTDFLESGTVAMRDNNPFPRSGTLVLGSFLLVCAGLCLVALCVFAVASANKAREADNAQHGLEAAAAYYELLASVVYPSTMDSSYFEEGGGERDAFDEGGSIHFSREAQQQRQCAANGDANGNRRNTRNKGQLYVSIADSAFSPKEGVNDGEGKEKEKNEMEKEGEGGADCAARPSSLPHSLNDDGNETGGGGFGGDSMANVSASFIKPSSSSQHQNPRLSGSLFGHGSINNGAPKSPKHHDDAEGGGERPQQQQEGNDGQHQHATTNNTSSRRRGSFANFAASVSIRKRSQSGAAAGASGLGWSTNSRSANGNPPAVPPLPTRSLTSAVVDINPTATTTANRCEEEEHQQIIAAAPATGEEGVDSVVVVTAATAAAAAPVAAAQQCPIKPLRLSAALEWLSGKQRQRRKSSSSPTATTDLSTEDLITILNEIKLQTSPVELSGESLILLLLKARLGNSNTKMKKKKTETSTATKNNETDGAVSGGNDDASARSSSCSDLDHNDDDDNDNEDESSSSSTSFLTSHHIAQWNALVAEEEEKERAHEALIRDLTTGPQSNCFTRHIKRFLCVRGKSAKEKELRLYGIVGNNNNMSDGANFANNGEDDGDQFRLWFGRIAELADADADAFPEDNNNSSSGNKKKDDAEDVTMNTAMRERETQQQHNMRLSVRR